MAMDGRYAENAGAIFGDAMDSRYAENAGAIFGDAMDGRYAGPLVLPAPAGTSHIHVGNAGAIFGDAVRVGTPARRGTFSQSCGILPGARVFAAPGEILI